MNIYWYKNESRILKQGRIHIEGSVSDGNLTHIGNGNINMNVDVIVPIKFKNIICLNLNS